MSIVARFLPTPGHVSAGYGERATHRSRVRSGTIRHPATQRTGGRPLRRNRGVQHAPLRGCHRGPRATRKPIRTATASDTARVWETCWLRKAITKRSRANIATTCGRWRRSTRPRATTARPTTSGGLGRNKWNRRKRRHKKRTRDHLCHAAHAVRKGEHHRLRGPDGIHEVRQVPPRTNRRLSGWVKGMMATHFNISAQRFCAGIGQSGLHIANRLPHGPVAGPTAMGPVSLHRRGCAGRRRQCRLQHSGEAVRRGDYAVHALQGRACPARGTNQDSGGDCSTRTRVALQPRSHQPRANYRHRCRIGRHNPRRLCVGP